MQDPVEHIRFRDPRWNSDFELGLIFLNNTVVTSPRAGARCASSDAEFVAALVSSTTSASEVETSETAETLERAASPAAALSKLTSIVYVIVSVSRALYQRDSIGVDDTVVVLLLVSWSSSTFSPRRFVSLPKLDLCDLITSAFIPS